MSIFFRKLMILSIEFLVIVVWGMAQVVPFPEFSNDANKIARALYLSGDFIHAQSLYSRALAANPSDYEACYVLGRIAAHSDAWQDAVDFQSNIIKLKPDCLQANLYYSQAFSEIMRNANVFQAAGKVGEFKAFIEKAARLFPREVEIQQVVVQFHITAPGIVGGNRDEARRLLPGLKSLSPSFGLRLEALLEDTEGRTDNAARLFAEAATYGQARTYLAWANWLIKRQKGAAAIQVLWDNRDKADRPLQMRYFIGRTCADTGLRSNDGIISLDEYLAGAWAPDFPTKADALYQKARIYLTLGKKAEARQALQASLAILPTLKRSSELLKTIGS